MNIENIKNIVFDFGGVICDLSPETCVANFQKIGLTGDIFPQQYSQFDGIFQQIDRGIMTASEFYDTLRHMSSMPGVTDQQIRDAWTSLVLPIQPERYEALRRLKDRFNLFILSNSNEIHWDFIERQRMTCQGEDVTAWFKGIFLSHLLHLEKPEAAVFQAVLDTAHIEAADTLFIDDSQANLDGAAALGFQTLLAKGGDWIAKLS